MRSLHLLLTVVAAASLTACAGSTPTDPSAPDALTPPVLSAEDVPPEARAAYLAGLAEIDPTLTSNEDRAIRRATSICQDIAEGKDEATVINETRERITGGEETFDDARVADVVELAREHVCKP